MNAPLKSQAPPMQELNTANHLLGNQEALKEAWERDGYWFFRDVLDREVIARIRRIYMDYLDDMGVADKDDAQAKYNGADLTRLESYSINQSPLNKAKVHEELHQAPTINRFFEELFGCAPFWVPFTVHRATPPALDASAPRLELIHADGFYNDGLNFLICWVPLAEIDEDVGGLSLVEGVHRQPSLHRKEGMKILPIRQEDVPQEQWRRTTYRPGDVLLMDLDTPHSGWTNHSDRFRLSMDTRVMPSSWNTPLVGTVQSVSEQSVTIGNGDGEHTLTLDEKSFVRGPYGDQMPLADIPGRFKPGETVIITRDHGRVVNMRPAT